MPVIELSERLAQLAPDNLNHVFYAGSGSEANDTNIRMVRQYWALKGHPERKVIISRKNAYHGSSLGSASLGGMSAMHAQGGMPIPDIHHINQPNWWSEGGDLDPEEFGLARARELPPTRSCGTRSTPGWRDSLMPFQLLRAAPCWQAILALPTYSRSSSGSAGLLSHLGLPSRDRHLRRPRRSGRSRANARPRCRHHRPEQRRRVRLAAGRRARPPHRLDQQRAGDGHLLRHSV